jgi:hypothetical protein
MIGALLTLIFNKMATSSKPCEGLLYGKIDIKEIQKANDRHESYQHFQSAISK